MQVLRGKPMPNTRSATGIIAAYIMTILVLSTCGSPPKPEERVLFLTAPAPARPYVNSRGSRLVRYVRLNPIVISQLTSGRHPTPFQVNLSNTQSITATTISNSDSNLEFRQWMASLGDTGNLRFLFRPDLSGVMRIETQGRIFEVAPTRTSGVYALSTIDQSAFPEGTDFLLSPGAGPAPQYSTTRKCDAPLPFPIPTKPIAWLTVLVLYTPAAAAGGDIHASVATAAARMQDAMQTSNFAVKATLAPIQQLNVTEARSMETDLRMITASSQVAALRNAYKADLVSLIGVYSDYCGIGWLNEGMHAGLAGHGYSVVAAGCLSNETLAHEIGHNLGMRHDAESDSGGGSNHGYIVHSSKVRTIMAYNDPCSRRGYFCRRINSYSSPQYMLGKGEHTGDSRSDNLEVLCRSAPIAEKFR
ncbi:reprolysin-like metallopeptidase [Mesorhizobium sp.]|uniref:reprolysin-like metallopeptidase n=1 Tax=Mesorhizobium sp. TaxID=1871066 RepID=UPI00257DC025|nr:M12 family metallo-peptidase [Mesorhizobium sp.]